MASLPLRPPSTSANKKHNQQQKGKKKLEINKYDQFFRFCMRPELKVYITSPPKSKNRSQSLSLNELPADLPLSLPLSPPLSLEGSTCGPNLCKSFREWPLLWNDFSCFPSSITILLPPWPSLHTPSRWLRAFLGLPFGLYFEPPLCSIPLPLLPARRLPLAADPDINLCALLLPPLALQKPLLLVEREWLRFPLPLFALLPLLRPLRPLRVRGESIFVRSKPRMEFSLSRPSSRREGRPCTRHDDVWRGHGC